MKEINILSIAGRSLWLANVLCRQGFKVKLYDVTEGMSGFVTEDVDGPFLVRDEPGIEENFKSFFKDRRDLRLLDQGFCLSCPSGNISGAAKNYEDILSSFNKDFYNEASSEASFWYDDFLKSFGKVRFKKSDEWREESSSFDPEGVFYIRSSEENHHKIKVDTLVQRGVEYIPVDVTDVRQILNLIKSQYKKWIVALTITELKIYTSTSLENLDYQLGWHRKRFVLKRLEDKKKLLSFPVWSVWINSFYKTWKDENLYILIKGKNGNHIDLWSIEAVYNQKSLDLCLENAKHFLSKKLPYVELCFDGVSVPDSNLKTLFPVSTGYSEINDTRFMWNSPREWLSYNSESVYNYQNEFAKWLGKNFLKGTLNDITL